MVTGMRALPLTSSNLFRSGAREDWPCLVQDPELWFGERPEQVEQAKAFCRTCSARTACLEQATDHREPWGVWGGELFAGGRVAACKRPRGRPRRAASPDVATRAAATGHRQA